MTCEMGKEKAAIGQRDLGPKYASQKARGIRLIQEFSDQLPTDQSEKSTTTNKSGLAAIRGNNSTVTRESEHP